MKKSTILLLSALIVIFISVPTIILIYNMNSPRVHIETSETYLYPIETFYPDGKGGEFSVWDWVCYGGINANESATILEITAKFNLLQDIWVFRQLKDNGYGSGITIFQQYNISSGYNELTYTPTETVTIWYLNNQKIYTLCGDYIPLYVVGNINLTITYKYIG